MHTRSDREKRLLNYAVFIIVHCCMFKCTETSRLRDAAGSTQLLVIEYKNRELMFVSCKPTACREITYKYMPISN